jgi:tetratricopeptide (TPR) repeat protein
MKDYPTALTYFQKGLQIREEKLPKNHPDLAVIYHNLAKLYFSTREYSIAMKNAQQAVDIAQEKLSSNHSDLLDYRKTLDEIRKNM